MRIERKLSVLRIKYYCIKVAVLSFLFEWAAYFNKTNAYLNDMVLHRKAAFFINHGFRIKIFKTNATKQRDNNMIKVAVYPPVISKILFDTVAMREPPITVKVIIAMLVGRYFMPKKDEVNAAVMVGQAPYEIPVKHKPIMQSGREPMKTASKVTAEAKMVRILAHIMVLRRPMLSKSAPVRIRPKPLQTESTPTRETASDSGAFTERARSLAKLMTELPTAARKEMQIKAIQKEGRRSI